MEPESRRILSDFAEKMCNADAYDFHMGRKLSEHMQWAGFAVLNELTLPDTEFCFDGPATPDVLEAWSARLARMSGLQRFCGQRFDQVRSDFLAALAHPEHCSLAKVYCCIGIR